MNGVTFLPDPYMPAGRFALMRDGGVAAIGTMATLGNHYRPGDTVIVSQDTYEGLQAHFAKDVTPRPALSDSRTGAEQTEGR